MSEFLVEAYTSRVASATPAGEELVLAAEQLTREGRLVRFLHSIFVPEEETCFYLYEGQSVEAVREAALRAGVRPDRVSEASSNWLADMHVINHQRG